MCRENVELKGFVSLMSSTQFGSYILFTSSSMRYLEPRSKEYDEDILFRIQYFNVSQLSA